MRAAGESMPPLTDGARLFGAAFLLVVVGLLALVLRWVGADAVSWWLVILFAIYEAIRLITAPRKTGPAEGTEGTEGG